jgi:chromate transporter
MAGARQAARFGRTIGRPQTDPTRMPKPQPPTPATEERPRPRSTGDLFWSFTWLALQGFGGVLAVVQRELVEKKRWMTNEEFVEDWAVAQIMPGPNVVNLSVMIGDRYFGLRGAVAALAGMLTFPLLLVLVLAITYAQFASHPAVAGALRGMGAVAAGLVAGVGLKLAMALRRHPLGAVGCVLVAALTFGGMALLRLPLAWVLPVLGGTACALTWRKIPA